ncbi:MAG: beta-N-acetylhexosaminidase [Chloroflexi bacterium]|nr:beta-N-acetylhexosaminidase [Chloroflexota bacterium]
MIQTLERRIGRMCFVGFEGLTAPDYLLEWIRAGRVGGVILFARNVASPQQVADLTAALNEAAGPEGIIVSIDQEGGTVTRMHAAEGFTEVPGAMALAATASAVGDDGERHAERMAAVLADELRAVGISWDYAPVVDLFYNSGNPSLGTRSFGSDPDRVGRLAAAVVRGLQSRGVAACAKHFPGLGSSTLDTHIDLPVDERSLEWLLANDLEPYRQVIGAGIASIMVTHTIIAAIDPALPATLSPLVVRQLLRERLGFDGVVSTDCMEMGAITEHFGAGDSAVLAALGSIDAILFSHTVARQEAAYEALLAAARSGELPEETIDAANRRLAAFQTRYVQPPTSLDVIRSAENRAAALEAARAGVVLVKGEAGAAEGAPLTFARGTDGRGIGVVEFASALDSGIVEAGGLTGFGRGLRAHLPGAEVMVWQEKTHEAALALADRCETLIVATRSAHLSPQRTEAARGLLRASGHPVLAALRGPFDARLFIEDAEVVLCSLGDAEPQIEAAAEALAGVYAPSGRLPVEERSL